MSFPYVFGTLVLLPCASKALSERLHCYRSLAGMLGVVLGCPVMFVTDVFIAIRYPFSQPEDQQLFHYMNLRKILEIFEGVPQVFLQTFLLVRQINPGGLFSEMKDGNVKLTVLILSIAGSAYAIVDFNSDGLVANALWEGNPIWARLVAAFMTFPHVFGTFILLPWASKALSDRLHCHR